MTGENVSLTAEHLAKELGGRLILRDVSFSLRSGECIALYGANGAGKSTLLSVLATLTKPSGGRLRWNGQEVAKSRRAYRREIGLVGHEPLIYLDWSGRANLRFFARLYGVTETRVDALLEEVGLSAFADDPVHIYSRGMVQRLTIARAFLHAPKLLLLDEFFTGLDPSTQRRLAARLIAERYAGAAILLVTHDLDIGREVATASLCLRNGILEAGEGTGESDTA
jgi:heme exporter protein A